MVDFNALLKKTLSIVSEGYERAFNDLETVVDKLSTAIKENAGGDFALAMSTARSDVKGTIFRIYFDTNVDDPEADVITIVHIMIPSIGYPIYPGVYNYKSDAFNYEGKIDDFEELEQYFKGFLESPESTFIQALGFAIRNLTGKDDIPF
ncbi:hypothetical protein [Undibacterium sp. Ji49W]|uniref:hypothetical protein n=1 Tax=Undibacterium sp. Ji49W TaxID=3413040 RepID=UPI003BF3F34E